LDVPRFTVPGWATGAAGVGKVGCRSIECILLLEPNIRLKKLGLSFVGVESVGEFSRPFEDALVAMLSLPVMSE